MMKLTQAMLAQAMQAKMELTDKKQQGKMTR
jgi:hypothetical protein